MKIKETIERLDYDITKFFTEDRGRISLLDRITPPKCDISEIEEMITDKSVSGITITYKQCLRDVKTEQELKLYLYYLLQKIDFNNDIDYKIKLLPDIDNNGNFHYHGLVKMKIKDRPLFKRMITRYCGFMKFEYIRNNNDWMSYIRKSPPKHTPVYSDYELLELSLEYS